MGFHLAIRGVKCLRRLLWLSILVSEIEHFLVDGEVTVCLVLTGLPKRFTVWFVRDWAFLQGYFYLVLAPSLESIVIE